MDIIIDFYTDLKRYSDRNVRLMARSKGLPTAPPNDLRWMLAIHNSQNKAQLHYTDAVLDNMFSRPFELRQLLDYVELHPRNKDQVQRYFNVILPNVEPISEDSVYNLVSLENMTNFQLNLLNHLVRLDKIDENYVTSILYILMSLNRPTHLTIDLDDEGNRAVAESYFDFILPKIDPLTPDETDALLSIEDPTEFQLNLFTRLLYFDKIDEVYVLFHVNRLDNPELVQLVLESAFQKDIELNHNVITNILIYAIENSYIELLDDFLGKSDDIEIEREAIRIYEDNYGEEPSELKEVINYHYDKWDINDNDNDSDTTAQSGMFTYAEDDANDEWSE